MAWAQIKSSIPRILSEAPEFQTQLSDPFGFRRSEWIFPEGELSPSCGHCLSWVSGEGVRAGMLVQGRQYFGLWCLPSSCVCGGLPCEARMRSDCKDRTFNPVAHMTVSFIIHRTPGLWGPIFLCWKISLCKIKRRCVKFNTKAS